MRHKYSCPGEWLQAKITKLESEGNAKELASLLVSILPDLDSDTIQDIFQDEMEDDGFFKQLCDDCGAELDTDCMGQPRCEVCEPCPHCSDQNQDDEEDEDD